MAVEQRTLHIVTEILAIPAGLLLIYIGRTTQMAGWKRLSLITMGAANLLIDGYLIMTWF
jgi:hypothetical protein